MTTVSESEKGVQVKFNDGTTVLFKRPGRPELSQALAAGARDPLGAVDVLVKRCLIDGNKATILENMGYCHQIKKVMDEIFGKVECILDWKDDPAFEGGVKASVEYLDGTMCILRAPTRQEYSAAQQAARSNPLRFAEDLLKAIWVAGPEEIKTSPGHILGFVEIADELLSYTGGALGN